MPLCLNSDEAIAAYLDVNGSSLKCLSLNNIIQVMPFVLSELIPWYLCKAYIFLISFRITLMSYV